MENNDGILGKHPSYIIENFSNVLMSCTKNPERYLDMENRIKFDKWIKTFMR